MRASNRRSWSALGRDCHSRLLVMLDADGVIERVCDGSCGQNLDLPEALTLDPKHHRAREYIAEAHVILGDLGKAKEHLPLAADRDGRERRQEAKEGQSTILERRGEIELRI
jgi:hypothetical protein